MIRKKLVICLAEWLQGIKSRERMKGVYDVSHVLFNGTNKSHG